VAQWRSLPLAAAQPTGAFGNPTYPGLSTTAPLKLNKY